jgi:hypothetical protein
MYTFRAIPDPILEYLKENDIRNADLEKVMGVVTGPVSFEAPYHPLFHSFPIDTPQVKSEHTLEECAGKGLCNVVYGSKRVQEYFNFKDGKEADVEDVICTAPYAHNRTISRGIVWAGSEHFGYVAIPESTSLFSNVMRFTPTWKRSDASY